MSVSNPSLNSENNLSENTLNAIISLNEINGVKQPEDELNIDPFVLRLAVKQSKLDLKNINQLIRNLESKIGNFESRRKFDDLKRKKQKLDEHIELLKQDYLKQLKDFKTLEGKVGLLLDRNDSLFEQSKKREETMTPRPNWNKCANFIAGGIKRWVQLTYTLSSDETLDFLLSEFGGITADDNVPSEFIGLGINDDVPIYLRATGIFRNYKLNRRDVLVMVRDIFSAKAIYDNSTYLKDSRRVPLRNFLLTFFSHRFESQQKIYEWCYNIVDGLKRFSYEYYPRLLKNILEEQVDEDIYHYFISYTYELFEYLSTYEYNFKEIRDFESYESHSQASSLFLNLNRRSKNDLIKRSWHIESKICEEALKKKFPSKAEAEIGELLNAARLDMENFFVKTQKFSRKKGEELLGVFDLRILFEEDDEGNVGEFLNTLRLQLEKCRLRYADKICYICATLASKKESKEKTQKSKANRTFKKNKKEKTKDPIPESSAISLKFTDFNDEFQTNDVFEEEATNNKSTSSLSEDVFIAKHDFLKATRIIDENITEKELRRYCEWVFKGNGSEPLNSYLSLHNLKTRLQNLNCYFHETVKK